MIYLLLAVVTIFTVVLLPFSVVIAVTVVAALSSIIVQVAAGFLTQSPVAFVDALKSVVLGLIGSGLVFFLCMPFLMATFGFAGGLIGIAGILLAQIWAYSSALRVSLLGGAAISICVTMITYILAAVLGVSFGVASKIVN